MMVGMTLKLRKIPFKKHFYRVISPKSCTPNLLLFRISDQKNNILQAFEKSWVWWYWNFHYAPCPLGVCNLWTWATKERFFCKMFFFLQSGKKNISGLYDWISSNFREYQNNRRDHRSFGCKKSNGQGQGFAKWNKNKTMAEQKQIQWVFSENIKKVGAGGKKHIDQQKYFCLF